MADSKLKTILKYFIFASAFIPLVIFSQFISPFHVGKAAVFRSMIELMAVFYIVLVLKDRTYLPRPNKLFWAVTLFALAFGLTTLTSFNRYQSFWGTLERMGGWFSFLHFWVFFVIISSVFRKKEEWLTLINVSLLASLLSSIYGFLQKTHSSWIVGSGGRNKIFGTIGNPALFAGYIIFGIFLSLMMFSRSRLVNGGKHGHWYLTVFLLNVLAVFLAGVRGSVLALAAGIVTFGFLLALSFGSRKLRKFTIGFVIFTGIIMAILFSFRNVGFVRSNPYLARYSDISLNTYTVKTRFWAWRAGFQGLTDSLRTVIVGYGPENFNIPFSKHFNPKFFRGPGSETLFDRAHNQFIEVLVTMGLVGFIAYASIFVFAFKFLGLIKLRSQAEDKESKILKVGLLATFVAYIIHNSFIFDTTANYLLFFTVLGFVNFMHSYRLGPAAVARNPAGKPASRRLRTNTAGIVLLAAALILIYRANIKPLKANYATTRAIVFSWAGKHDLAFEKFKEAMSYDLPGRYEIRQRYAQYIIEYAASRKIDDKVTERLLTAIDNVKKNIPESPDDYLPYLYISRSYVLLGRNDPNSTYNDLALENSAKALAISPTFVRTYYEVAQAHLNKKDYGGAIEAFQKAASLNPAVGVSWWYLAATQFESGDKAGGLESLDRAFASDYDPAGNQSDILKLINIYASVNDYPKVADFYGKLIALNPANPQYHASLAAAYARIGRIDEAVGQARLAAQLDPSFEKGARSFVKNLGREW